MASDKHAENGFVHPLNGWIQVSSVHKWWRIVGQRDKY